MTWFEVFVELTPGVLIFVGLCHFGRCVENGLIKGAALLSRQARYAQDE
jgi:hypothetical protein